MRPHLAIGVSDFPSLRRKGQPYVDKTSAVADLIEARRPATVFCRPRRFGKSLLLSTLRAFLERGPADLSSTFEGLAIWGRPAARAHFQRHPVIHISLKDVKGATWAQASQQVALAVKAECERLAWLHDGLEALGRSGFQNLVSAAPDMEGVQRALIDLSVWLHRLTGEEVVILVDEVDAPIHLGQSRGYYREVLDFLRSFLGGGLKDNPVVMLGVVTGVLRVSREGLFSSFNNAAIYSILDEAYASAFGFLEYEVEQLRLQVDSPLSLAELRHWYNGYRIGGLEVYNPWSVLCALDRQKLDAWWVDSGSHEALGRLLLKGGEPVQRDLRRWMLGDEVPGFIEDTVLLAHERPSDIVALLVHGGYLTPVSVEPRASGGWQALLRVPNQDVAESLLAASRRWLMEMELDSPTLRDIGAGLLGGDARFGDALGRLLRGAASFHDFPFADAERGYHTFLLGLLVSLEPRHQLRSNAESGYGRADLLVLPRQAGQVGAVIELKRVASADEAEAALDTAAAQLGLRAYDQALIDRGATPIRRWAVVFCGKLVWTRLM